MQPHRLQSWRTLIGIPCGKSLHPLESVDFESAANFSTVIMSLLLVLVLELMWLCVGVYTQSPGEIMKESSSTMICLYRVSSSPHIYCCC